jgi:hypothetical protein
MIVVIMNYISCNTFLFIKFRMYILRNIDFFVKILQYNYFIKLIVTKWPYVNCIVWIMWLMFFYMTSTIGLCVLDFLGSSNVLFLVHFECIYQQMKLWVAFKWPIDVGLILASSNTPIFNYEFSECIRMVNRHTSILASSNTPTNEALGGHSIGQ